MKLSNKINKVCFKTIAAPGALLFSQFGMANQIYRPISLLQYPVKPWAQTGHSEMDYCAVMALEECIHWWCNSVTLTLHKCFSGVFVVH